MWDLYFQQHCEELPIQSQESRESKAVEKFSDGEARNKSSEVELQVHVV